MKIAEVLFKPLKDINVRSIGRETEADLHTKKLTLEEHLKLLVAYVVCLCTSLRELTENSIVHKSLLNASTSQLSKLNSQRDYTSFVLVFYKLLCHPSNYRKCWRMREFLKKKILGIDSTTISMKTPLKLLKGDLPLTEKERCGIKIHTAALLSAMVQPLSAIVTPSNVHDNVMFDDILRDVSLLENLQDIILVVDKGYTDYNRYRELISLGILFIVQLKKNAKYVVLRSIDYGHYIEEKILLDGMELRLVKYRDDREWVFITNISSIDLSADDIREIYRLRWMIEIFFRQLKHAVKIKHLYSKNVNGVMIQLYATLIAYTLVNMYRLSTGSIMLSLEKTVTRLKHTFSMKILPKDYG